MVAANVLGATMQPITVTPIPNQVHEKNPTSV
jgi:hypothetical protein